MSGRGVLAWVVLASFVGAGGSAWAAGAKLESVRAVTDADGTRVVLELDRDARYRVFTLADPHRVVIDLDDTRLTGALGSASPDGLVRGLRTGARSGGGLRVVVDVRSRVTPEALLAAPAGEAGARLVVRLRAPGAVAKAPEPALPKPIQPRHAPTESGRDVVVAVDAGHGGKDPGAIGPSGTREKEVVLAISRALVERINAEPGMRAFLVRDGDYYIAHRERIARARRGKADLFVSVHADSLRNPAVSGASVYVLSERGATDEAARWLAERENAADLKGGVSLDDKDNAIASVLLDLSQTASIASSMQVAERLLASIDRVGEVRKPRVQQAGFLVLKSPDIPSVLVETAYISNPGDERRLRSDAHRARLAEAITAGIRDYFTDNPPDGSRFAARRRFAGQTASAPAAP
jgi:N-acetylmuramoyl-L-alanine amidase